MPFQLSPNTNMNKEGTIYFSWKSTAPPTVKLNHLLAYCKRIFQNVVSITPDVERNRVVVKTSYTFKTETVTTKLNIVPSLGQHIKWSSNGSLSTTEEADLDELLALVGESEPDTWTTLPTPKKRKRPAVDDSDDEAEPVTHRKARSN